jgi:hypothetical protein
MSLDKRSIELGDGQWAVKEDKLFAFRRDRDKFFERSFDFSRASEGTIINSDGYIQYSGFSDELVVNGDFEDGENGWNPVAGNFDIINGKAVVNHTNDSTFIIQNNVVTVGKFYRVEFTISDYSEGRIRLRYPFINGELENNPRNGTFVYYGEAIDHRLELQSRITENANYKIDNISVKEVEQETPRISYDIVDGVVSSDKHLLLEPARTNLITYSEDFSTWSNTGNETTDTSNQAVSPKGVLNATKLQESNSNFGYHRLSKSFTGSANTDYALSVFAKKGTSNYVQLLMINIGDSKTISRVFDLENGVIGEELSTSGQTLTDSKIEDYGNGWYRCTIVGELSTAPNLFRINLANAATGNTENLQMVQYTGDGTGNIYIFGAQLEQAPYASSYIPTYGTIETRASEIADNSGNVGDFNSDEGVLYAEIAALADDLTFRVVSISDGSNNNVVKMGYRSDSNRIYCEVRSGANSQAFLVYEVTDITEFNRVAVKFKENDFALWINGQEALTDPSGITNIPFLHADFKLGISSDIFYGKCKALKVYTEALNDAELRLLTKYAPRDYDVAFTADYVDTIAEINILRTEATDKLYYVISDGANEVSGSATITATEVTISNIDISSLNDGTLTVSVYIEDETKQRGVTVTDTTIKDNTNTPLYSYALQQRATGAVIEDLDNAEAIIESLNVEV